MSRQRPPKKATHSDANAALDTMSADELRVFVREIMLELDDKAHNRVVNSLIQRTARNGSGWAPAAVGDAQVAEVIAFVKAAQHRGHADPSQIDEYLQRGSSAFLRKDYETTHRIFGALFPPIGSGEIDLGQDELADEVLGTDTTECAAQYVVTAYMLSPPAERATAVRTAIEVASNIGYIFDPIEDMENVAVEPLPGLDHFLGQWRDLLLRKTTGAHAVNRGTEQELWLREVVQRLEGSDGLAKVARSTKRADDLRAWCQSLVDTGDWKAALPAFEEAAGLVTDKEFFARGAMMDGAVLAAQELGRNDLPKWIERAWRISPSMMRLRRWLGLASNKATLQKRITAALAACPQPAARQHAFLYVLQGDFEAAAKLLAAAPGLGWSGDEHPGHLLFPLFAVFLAGKKISSTFISDLFSSHGMGIEDLAWTTIAAGNPKLATPEISQIMKTAGTDATPKAAAKRPMLASMQKAAERRLAGVTDKKRRGHYGHAAELVAICVTCDPSPETARWVALLKAEYRQFPALRTKLDRALGSK
jgi:hypothetical protein